MPIEFDPQTNASQQVQMNKMETYVAFRGKWPKPSNEDAHIRHILRFYVARAFLKQGDESAYVLPDVSINGEKIAVDVLSRSGDKLTLAICEPESISEETEDIIEKLKGEDGLHIMVLHSQYGKPGNVEQKFKSEIDSKKIRIMAVVPPPFDDVYEYDIWMFETTFRELFSGN